MIQRAKKWFERNHPFIKMDRGQDLFPCERAKASAEAQLARRGEETTGEEDPSRAARFASTPGVRPE